MKLSIIMPAYNSAKVISNAIKSILNQSFTDFELIIINDGSVDNTEQIVEKFKKVDQRIKYFSISNSGSGVARNIGIENANGEYIGFVDADDSIEINMYKTLIEEAEKYDSDIVGSSFIQIRDGKQKPEITHYAKGFYDKERLIKDVYPSIITSEQLTEPMSKNIWSKIFKKSLIQSHEIKFTPSLRMSQDVIFCLTCFLYAETFYYLPDAKNYNYIYNDSSRTHTYLENGWEIMYTNYKITEDLVNLFPDYNISEQLPYSIVRNAMGALINEGVQDNKISTKRRKNNIKEVLTNIEVKKGMKKVNYNFFPFSRKIFFIAMRWAPISVIYVMVVIYNKYFRNRL